MNWAFVDYENIGNLDGVVFNNYERILIFCGPKNSKINLGSSTISSFLKIEIIKLKSTGANNLDFHLSYYLGKFSQTAQSDVQFHVITNDNGFNGLLSHINKTGRVCKKITVKTNSKSKEKSKDKPKPLKLTSCAELAVKRLKQIDGRKRPRKKEKLINWIESQCRSLTSDNDINAAQIFNELLTKKLLSNESKILKYKLIG